MIADESMGIASLNSVLASGMSVPSTVSLIQNDTSASLARSELAAAPSVDSLRLSRTSARDQASLPWHVIPEAEMTSELKRDMKLLLHRHVLDPKRHYKRLDFSYLDPNAGKPGHGPKAKKPFLPTRVQMGAIVESEFTHKNKRVFNREKGRTLVEEMLLKDAATKGYTKRKSTAVHEERTKAKGRARHIKHHKKVSERHRLDRQQLAKPSFF
jgi:hypothetical protein